MTEKFIQEAISSKKEGATHRMLGIPKDTAIPFTLLEAIRTAPIGTRVKNPTQVGYKFVKVTRLLKQRAVLALNLKRIGQGR